MCACMLIHIYLYIYIIYLYTHEHYISNHVQISKYVARDIVTMAPFPGKTAAMHTRVQISTVLYLSKIKNSSVHFNKNNRGILTRITGVF